MQTRKGTIRGNWCFHNQPLATPQDQWVWSKEEWGERQGGKSLRRSEWAKNAVGACSRWLGVRSCQKVLQHHHAIRNRGHVAQTTLPLHPPLPPKNFPPFRSQYLCVPGCPTPCGSWRWKMHFSDSVWGVYWLWVLQLVEGYCHVYKAGVFAALRSGLWLLPLAWLDWEELSLSAWISKLECIVSKEKLLPEMAWLHFTAHPRKTRLLYVVTSAWNWH